MDFELTDDQQMLSRTVADFVSKESTLERARKLRDDERGWESAVWRQMGELGWLAVCFPEEVGGFGGSMVEAALILEKLGTTLVPEPYVPSVILAGTTLLHGGNAEQIAAFLTPMLEGETSLALAHSERCGRYDRMPVETFARPEGDGYRLDGEKVWVLNGHAADHLIVSASIEGGAGLFIVDPGAEGVTIRSARTIDGRRAAMIRFEKVLVAADRRLMERDALDVLDIALDLGAVAAVAEGLGGALTMLAMTVEYLKTREQFGVKIGSFQALQHRAADMFVETELLRSISMEAMVRANDPDDDARRASVSAAKVQLARSGQFVARESVQLHGGVGVTDEHDIGLYFKRQVALDALFGDAEWHLERFGQLPGF